MPTYLDTILQYKAEEVQALSQDQERCGYLHKRAVERTGKNAALSLVDSIAKSVTSRGIAVIAECKRASPSKGMIRENYDPVAIARGYEKGGAAGVSVLTDGRSFKGAIAHMEHVKESVQIPVLRKDFLLEPIQVMESYALGADAVLVIISALTDDKIAQLCSAARQYSMDVLLEVHDAQELQRAADIAQTIYANNSDNTPFPDSGGSGGFIIGVNNRDLKTFQVNPLATYQVHQAMQDTWLAENTILISESGIRTAQDIKRLKEWGAQGFLIGEALMMLPTPGRGLISLMHQVSQE